MPLILHADTNPVTEFFPVEPEPVPDPVRAEATAEEVDDMARTVLQSAVGMPGTEVPNKFIYEAYRKVDDLPPTAKLFYNALSKYLEQTLKRVPIFKSKTDQLPCRFRSRSLTRDHGASRVHARTSYCGMAKG